MPRPLMPESARTPRLARRLARPSRLAVLALALLASPPWPAVAVIDPNFTPVDLAQRSEAILELAMTAGEEGTVSGTVARAIKGAAGAGPVVFDLKGMEEAHAREIRDAVGGPRGKVGLLFVGPAQADAAFDAGLLHVAGRWVRLKPGAAPGRAFAAARIDDKLQATWAGGTDMLARASAQLLKDPRPYMPTGVQVTWQPPLAAGKAGEKPGDPAVVDLNDGKPPVVFVPSPAGDRAFRWDAGGKGLKDVTADLRLQTKSAAAAWADVNADGRLDLVSLTPDGVVAATAADGGSFAAPAKLAAAEEGWRGLSVVTGEAGPAFVVSTAKVPLLLARDGTGAWRAAPLPRKDVADGAGDLAEADDFGEARPCVTADLDGDGHADVLQPFERGALLYKGVAAGRWARPVPAGKVRTGDGHAVVRPGDFDGDGRLDLFVAGEGGVRLWAQGADGLFAEAKPDAGELAYHSKPEATGGSVGDFNNDGLPDLLVTYARQRPQLYFNRGFRSFGEAPPPAPLAEDGGFGGGLLADVDGDGAQDLVLVSAAAGEVQVLLRNGPDLACRVVAGPCTGPVTVAAWQGDRCMGAWDVAPGRPPAFVGVRNRGPLRLRWTTPSGQAREKTVNVIRGTERLVVGAADDNPPKP